MPRLARKNLESPYCHVIVQGINREYIFKDNNMKDAYKNILKKNLEETNVEILAYCIMDNHVHLLMYSDKPENMTKLMHKTNTSFAKLYNKVNNRVGYVYRGRYYVQQIKTEEQLYNCMVYIHRNPIKANIVLKMKDYKYSSYREFYGIKDVITSNGIKLVFGSSINYIDEFREIHKNREIENVAEIIIEKDAEKVINDFMEKHDKKIEEITKNEELFNKLLLELRHVSKSTLVDMEKIFNISKNKLNKIINKKL